jgi:hypothetical protein
MAAGPWQINIDEMCDSTVELRLGMFLESDGTALLHAGQTFTGTWSLEGSSITIIFTSPENLTLTGALSMNGNNLTNGSSTGAVVGCWTAQRIQY